MGDCAIFIPLHILFCYSLPHLILGTVLWFKKLFTLFLAFVQVHILIFTLVSLAYFYIMMMMMVSIFNVTLYGILFKWQLEKYDVARDVILSGLQVDPFRYCTFTSLVLFLFYNSYFTPIENIGWMSECRDFASHLVCYLWPLFHCIWYHVVIPFGNVFKEWKEYHLVQLGGVHMDNQSGMMTLIALSAWSYCMNLSQPPVDIHFAVHVYFRQWIVVSDS